MFADVRRLLSRVVNKSAWVPLLALALALGGAIIQMPGGGGGPG